MFLRQFSHGRTILRYKQLRGPRTMNLPQTPKENRAGKASERGWREQAGGDGRAGFAQWLASAPSDPPPACLPRRPLPFPVSLAGRLLREAASWLAPSAFSHLCSLMFFLLTLLSFSFDNILLLMFLHLTASKDLSGTPSLKGPFVFISMVEAVTSRTVPPQLHPACTRM